jgi:hypothetical protein
MVSYDRGLVTWHEEKMGGGWNVRSDGWTSRPLKMEVVSREKQDLSQHSSCSGAISKGCINLGDHSHLHTLEEGESSADTKSRRSRKIHPANINTRPSIHTALLKDL